MALFFTLLYIVAAYLAPETLFGDLALYHIEILIVTIALLLSLPSFAGAGLAKMAQTWAILGISLAGCMSIVFSGWIGGGPQVLLNLAPNTTAFFLIYLCCRKKWQLQAVTAALFCIGMFIVCRAQYDLLTGNVLSKYLLIHSIGDGGPDLVRIRGLSFLGDPNDLSQFLVALVPCIFMFWRKRKAFTNLIFVCLPTLFLIYGIYLTHSRGAMLALAMVAVAAGRNKIGTIKAGVIGGGLLAVLTALGFSGGRDVTAGEDRMGAWSAGLELFRSHPIFGVGYSRFTEFYEITAHNTIVVCAAELGFVGFFFWILFVFVTLRNVYQASQSPAVSEAEEDDRMASNAFGGIVSVPQPVASAPAIAHAQLATPEGHLFSQTPSFLLSAAPSSGPRHAWDKVGDSEADAREIRRLASLMVVSLVGFLTAGWFLSRAYTMVLYVYAGMAAAVYRMAFDRGLAPPPLSGRRASKLTVFICLGLLILVYIIVRLDHLVPR